MKEPVSAYSLTPFPNWYSTGLTPLGTGAKVTLLPDTVAVIEVRPGSKGL